MEIFLPFLGGLLIAIASSANYLLNGKITGFSGMFWSLISFQRGQLLWKLVFISSVVFTGALVAILKDIEKSPLLLHIEPKKENLSKGLSFIGFCIAGFLVGFGTKLGNGCTSGHGVCGLPRFSKRSWVAVGVFFSTAMAVANLRNYFPFLQDSPAFTLDIKVENSEIIFAIISGIILIICFIYSLAFRRTINVKEIFASVFSGSIFSLGLILSGMIKRDRILNFLVISENWDPSLAIVLGTTVMFNIFSFNIIDTQQNKPLFTEQFQLPKKSIVDLRLVLGAFIFGLGWGIGGLCPGPAILNAQYFVPHITIGFMGFMAIGCYLEHIISKFTGDSGPSKEKSS